MGASAAPIDTTKMHTSTVHSRQNRFTKKLKAPSLEAMTPFHITSRAGCLLSLTGRSSNGIIDPLKRLRERSMCAHEVE